MLANVLKGNVSLCVRCKNKLNGALFWFFTVAPQCVNKKNLNLNDKKIRPHVLGTDNSCPRNEVSAGGQKNRRIFTTVSIILVY